MELFQFPIHLSVHTILWILPIFILFTCRILHEQLDSLVNVSDRVNVEGSVLDCLYDFIIEDQIFDVGLGNHNTLFSGQTTLFTEIEESFDLVGHAADGLNLTLLVDGPSHGQILADRKFGKGGDDAVEFRSSRQAEDRLIY